MYIVIYYKWMIVLTVFIILYYYVICSTGLSLHHHLVNLQTVCIYSALIMRKMINSKHQAKNQRRRRLKYHQHEVLLGPHYLLDEAFLLQAKLIPPTTYLPKCMHLYYCSSVEYATNNTTVIRSATKLSAARLRKARPLPALITIPIFWVCPMVVGNNIGHIQ